ncbi:MAG: ABC transporter permease [Candidatus Hydrogenedentes bacterium]|nr:ABC transporter permease [Candidatus Hydrogenedentota bacterium]
MNSLRLIARSLVHYRRTHFGLFIGTALAAAILTGALAIGDSVNHTLRTYALLRLGHVQFAAGSGERLFSAELASAARARLGAPVTAALLLPGMAIYQDPNTGEKTQINKVQALGVSTDFWSYAESPPLELGTREAALDLRLAKALGVKEGDSVALRIAKPGLLSRDAPLSSREEEASQRANFTVKAIVTDAQMGRFSLTPSQLPPSNFFVRISDLQQMAACADQANLLLAGPGCTLDRAQRTLSEVWRPEFSGLRVTQRSGTVLQLETNRVFLDDATEKAALSLPSAQGTLTYLVNALRNDSHSTPYSFMTAGGELSQGLSDDEMVINSWLAERLAAHEGARITIAYYVTLPSNRFEERARQFTVKRILPMEDFDAEKALVPDFPGLSNVESCKDWKIGMPMDEQLLKDEANEAYWREYRQTPKALVTLAAGQEMWGNRFGRLTAVRFPSSTMHADDIMAGIAKSLGPRDAGIELRPVHDEALSAAAQATDLGGMFLGMSFFLLVSALTLMGLLYAFGMQQRAEELGTLAALGYPRGRIRTILLCEALAVALPGSIAGTGLGLAYAWALMAGLSIYWQDAVGRIPILFDIQLTSVEAGAAGGVVCALVSAAFTLQRLLRHGAAELMNADFSQEARTRPRNLRDLAGASVALIGAIALVVYAVISPPAEIAMPFFVSGALTLAAGLLFMKYLFSRASSHRGARPPTTLSLAILNGTRRRGRSLGIVSSLAGGGFLVLAVSAMQSDIGANADQRSSGTGGFALYAEATAPILDPATLSTAVPGVNAIGIRVHDGDDASCLNLNRALTPRVLGVDEQELGRLKAFSGESSENIWAVLNQDLGDGAIPALVGDSDTAMWTLKKKTGLTDGDSLTYRDDAGRDVSVKLAGQLPMRLSVFQGAILISLKNFVRLWPSQEGFRVFLLDTPPNTASDTMVALRNAFDRHGLDVTTTVARLALFHAVEGTYLSMFLALGGVGLMLGATATGVVALRNIFERRREIALLWAVGFSPDAVFTLLACEYGLLLVLGSVIGAVASVVAMLPTMVSSHAGVSAMGRLGVFALVLISAMVCAGLALLLGLRKTSVSSLRTE